MRTSPNAPLPLTISTYDGTGQAVHPSITVPVLPEAGPRPWQGYEYWMAFEPYPLGNAAKENPSLRASHDGIQWEKPAGIPDPIQPFPSGDLPSSEIEHLADAEAVLDFDGKMHLFFVSVRGGLGRLWVKSSTNAIAWSTAERADGNIPDGDDMMSPAIITEKHYYHMWYVSGYPAAQVIHVRSEYGLVWDSYEECDGLDIPGHTVWHISVIKDPPGKPTVSDTWEMLITAYPDGAGAGNKCSLFHATSKDRKTWTVTSNEPIIAPRQSDGFFDGDSIYRASMLKDSGGYRVWYSARYRWQVGHRVEQRTFHRPVGRSLSTVVGILPRMVPEVGVKVPALVTFPTICGVRLP